MGQAPKTYQAKDILSFLQSWVEFKKQTDKNFSLRKLANQAGLSPALLVMILNKKRNLSEKNLLRLLSVMDLRKHEKEALRLLFTIGDSEIPSVRSQAYRELQKLPGYKEENHDSTLTFSYLSNWINVAIREMANLSDFEATPQWIRGRLHNPPPVNEIQKSLDFLINNSYLIKTKDGKYHPSEKNLNCSEGVFKLSLGDFHRQMLKRAGEAIDDFSRQERMLLGHTLALSKKDYAQVFDILNRALGEIESLKLSSKPEEIFHIELMAFPITKLKMEKGGA